MMSSGLWLAFYALTKAMPLSLLINLLRRLISQEPGRWRDKTGNFSPNWIQDLFSIFNLSCLSSFYAGAAL